MDMKLDTFLATPLDDLVPQRSHAEIETHILNLFRQVAANVPGYQAFLQDKSIEPDRVQSLADFQQLPLTTKENYIRRYSLPELCYEGRIAGCDFISASSGSTGQPTFWARRIEDELEIATRFEQVFHDSFQAKKTQTLAVVCFPLGTWVGGLYTTSCCRYLAAKGYPITLVTPGNNKTEILRVVTALAPLYAQTVLLGYPPFLKDAIDTGIAQGIQWETYNVKLVMAGEVFSEEWRTLVGQRLGSTNFCYDSTSLYGTADAGVLGNETPLSICIRRWLSQQPDIARELFGKSRLPTLIQYDPLTRFFEVEEGTLLFSGDNGIPLIRYHIADTGGIIGYDEMLAFLADKGFVPQSQPELQGSRGIRALPFAYVFGRSQFAISYFGANIYPENVTVGLEQSPICEWVTGKFVMQIRETSDRNAELLIVVELAPGEAGTDERVEAIANSILFHLRRLNSEFANYIPELNQTPQVELRLTGDAEYFPVGVKHRYTR
ncbi:MAG: phenylacetate--CoA ligase family protein [Acaryochloridaceae cyanobacterium RU_4_10]|nr:phenylacetate--CoA ligase family protein [Acaryochloridaceae cyanobacterium RU_4_10]